MTTADEALRVAVSEHEARFYARQVDRVVEGLHALAEHIEREGKPRTGTAFGGTPRFADSAYKVHHTLAWGMANPAAANLIDAAGRADHAEAQEAKESKSGWCNWCWSTGSLSDFDFNGRCEACLTSDPDRLNPFDPLGERRRRAEAQA